MKQREKKIEILKIKIKQWAVIGFAGLLVMGAFWDVLNTNSKTWLGAMMTAAIVLGAYDWWLMKEIKDGKQLSETNQMIVKRIIPISEAELKKQNITNICVGIIAGFAMLGFGTSQELKVLGIMMGIVGVGSSTYSGEMKTILKQ